MTCIALWYENESKKIPHINKPTYFGREPKQLNNLFQQALKECVSEETIMGKYDANDKKYMPIYKLVFKDGSWLEVTTPRHVKELFFYGSEFFAFWK
jgi:hypothetical protein